MACGVLPAYADGGDVIGIPLSCTLEEGHQLRDGDARGFGFAQDLLRTLPFAGVQLQNFLLHSAGGDPTIDCHGLCLADSMDAVGGLLFDGRIPPRIRQNDITGGCQIQSRTASLQADQEEVTLSCLEVIDRLHAVSGWR